MERLRKKRQKSPRNLYGRGESETKLKGSLIIMNGFLHFLRCIIHFVPYIRYTLIAPVVDDISEFMGKTFQAAQQMRDF